MAVSPIALKLKKKLSKFVVNFGRQIDIVLMELNIFLAILKVIWKTEERRGYRRQS